MVTDLSNPNAVVKPVVPNSTSASSGITGYNSGGGAIYGSAAPATNTATTVATPKAPVTPSGSNTYQPVAPQTYGQSIVDTHGVAGVAKFDPNTGQALAQPTNPNNNGTTGTTGLNTAPYTGTPQQQSDLSANQAQLKQEGDAIYAKGQQVSQLIDNIQNGVIPLNPGEQAQVDSLKNQFQTIIDSQVNTNANAIGSGRASAYRNGGAEGTDLFNSTVKPILEAGQNKLAGYQTQMAGAVAALTQSLRDNDIKNAKLAYDTLKSATTEHATALQKVISDTQQAIKDEQARQDKLNQDYYDQVTKPIQTIAVEAAKNGADSKTVADINAKTSVNDAISASGGYLQSATGPLGDYLQYQRDTNKKGLVPMDYTSYKDAQDKKASALKASEAYSSAYNTAAGKAAAEAKFGGANGSDTVSNLAQQLVSGNLAPSELFKRATGAGAYNAVLKAADDYSMNTTGKHFDIAQADRQYKFAQRPQTQDTLNYLGSLVGSVDENGNVTGGNLTELKNISNSITRTSFPALNNTAAWARLASGDPQIAQYQAVTTEVADQVAKILQGGNGGGGTSDAKLQQAVNLFNTGFSKAQLNGVIDSLTPLLVNRADSMIKGNPYLNDYAEQFGTQSVMTPDKQAQNQVESFVTTPQASARLDPAMNAKISSITGGQTFNTAGELSIYMSKLPGATPEGVVNALKSLGLMK